MPLDIFTSIRDDTLCTKEVKNLEKTVQEAQNTENIGGIWHNL